MNKPPSSSVQRAAARAAEQPYFLGYVLTHYRDTHHLDDGTLAAQIGCALADLPRLALCRRPRSAPADFRADITHLALRFGLDGGRLANLVREVDTLQALRRQTSQSQGQGYILRVARDRADDVQDEAEEPE